MKCHAITLDMRTLCGRQPLSGTIIDGQRNDRLAKLITCKHCLRLWRKITR